MVRCFVLSVQIQSAVVQLQMFCVFVYFIYFNTYTLKSVTVGIGLTFNKEYERLLYFSAFVMCCF